jgi:hypothetical protein
VFTCVTVYRLQPGTQEEFADRAKEELLPVLRTIAGFRSYSFVAASKHTNAYSISEWDSETDFARSVPIQMEWMKSHLWTHISHFEMGGGAVAFSYPDASVKPTHDN